MENFNLRKFLAENRMNRNSEVMEEGKSATITVRFTLDPIENQPLFDPYSDDPTDSVMEALASIIDGNDDSIQAKKWLENNIQEVTRIK